MSFSFICVNVILFVIIIYLMHFKLDINHIWVFFCIEDSDTTEHLVSIYFYVYSFLSIEIVSVNP